MALAIKSIPVLTGKVAQAFVKQADVTSTKKATVDFSKQTAVAALILAKAKLK